MFESIKTQFEQNCPISVHCQTENIRGRLCQRKVSVLLPTKDAFDPKWVGVQSLIQVERSGTRANQLFEETVFSLRVTT